MPDASDLAKRQEIGDRFIVGDGYEIGAGTSPSRYRSTGNVASLDKRNADELRALFKSDDIDKNVRPLSDNLPPLDFVIAHHVLEHLPNPIAGLMQWSQLLRAGGTMFLSIPSNENPCEKDRMPVTIEHILDDYLFDRDKDNFESRQHIPHFILQWTAMNEGHFWFTKNGVRSFAGNALNEIKCEHQDLHWHVFTVDVFSEMIRAAFWFSRSGAEIIHLEHAANSFYAVVQKTKEVKMPRCIRDHQRCLHAAVKLLEETQPTTLLRRMMALW